MEPFIADLINNPKVPKIIRYGMVTLLCLFIIFIGVVCAINSPIILGKIFGILLAILFFIVEIYLYIKISKSNK